MGAANYGDMTTSRGATAWRRSVLWAAAVVGGGGWRELSSESPGLLASWSSATGAGLGEPSP